MNIFKSYSGAAKLIFPFVILAASASAFSGEAEIRKNLMQRMPKFPIIDSIKKTPMAGLYEVRSGPGIYYSDENGDHLFAGVILETKTQTNLTEVAMKSMDSKKFKSLPLSDAIKVVRGDGKKNIVVFSDPSCPYCRKLEQELLKIDNVTIHTFLFPILGPKSVSITKDVWCSIDPAKSWSDWMLLRTPVPSRASSCSTDALDRNVSLGRSLKLTGAPAMIFEDGSVLKGAADVSTIESRIKAATSN